MRRCYKSCGVRETASNAVGRTGQTQCYDTAGTIIGCTGSGQDGETQLGVAWTAQRFSNNLDGTITDNFTNIVWAANANLVVSRDVGWDADGSDDGAVTWQHALDYILKLNSEAYLGYTNWRLPNVSELQSLMNNGSDMNTWLAAAGFSNIATNYWSSTTNRVTPSYAWLVHVGDGLLVANGGSNPSTLKTSTYFIWPIREPL